MIKSIAAFLVLAAALAAQYFPPPDSGGGWRARRPPAQTLAKLDRALECAKGATKHGGLLVVHRGWLVYEKYFGRGGREATPNGASSGKAFTSIAVGILLGERPDLFPEGLDQKVFTPRYLPPEIFPLDDPAKADIKLGHLLTMTAGLAGNNPAYVRGRAVQLERTGADGWEAMVDSTALATPLWTKPGEGYCYATVSPHILSIILRKLTGMELQSYLEEKLARPLGWGRWGYAYKRAEVTHTPGGGGIAIRPTDMLRFLYLLLHQGRWNGRQIVPASYVRLCGRPSPYNPHRPSYGLHFFNNAGAEVAGAHVAGGPEVAGAHVAGGPEVAGAHVAGGPEVAGAHVAGGPEVAGAHVAGGPEVAGAHVAGGPEAAGAHVAGGPEVAGAHVAGGPEVAGAHVAGGPEVAGAHVAGGPEVAGAPRDAFWFGGSGGYNFYVVPSLDLVIYRLAGRDAQYDPALTNVPPPPAGLAPYDGSRESWKQPRPEPVVTGEVLRLVTEAFRER